MHDEEAYIENEICCRFMGIKLHKKYAFIVVCTLLFTVIVSVIAALYQGITLNKFNSLAIGLGIWLPSILLGMICVYLAVKYVQEHRKRSSISLSSDDLNSHNRGDVVQYSNENRETRINLQMKGQPKIDRESVIAQWKTGQKALEHAQTSSNEDLPNLKSRCERRRHFRSVSSSNLRCYGQNENLCRRKSERRESRSRRTSDVIFLSKSDLQQAMHHSKRREFKRSVSERRAFKCEDEGPGEYTFPCNELIDSPIRYTESKRFVEGGKRGKFDGETVDQPPRIQQRLAKCSSKGIGDFVKYKCESEFFPTDDLKQGNERYNSGSYREMQSYPPESTRKPLKYAPQRPEMTGFNASNMMLHSHGSRPVFYHTPTKETEFLRSNMRAMDCYSRTGNRTADHAYRSNFKSSDSLLKSENNISTQQRTEIIPHKVQKSTASQLPSSRIGIPHFPKHFDEDECLSFNRKMTGRKSPFILSRENEQMQIHSMNQRQLMAIAPLYNVRSQSVGYLPDENC